MRHALVEAAVRTAVQRDQQQGTGLPRFYHREHAAHRGVQTIELIRLAQKQIGWKEQRVKLATELSKRSTGKTVYILDEPTTGLHTDDVAKILKILQRFADNGNTVIVIEHNLDVIKVADYIVDLGYEGGDKGGTVIAKGTPEQVAMQEKSYTGQFLKKILNKENDNG